MREAFRMRQVRGSEYESPLLSTASREAVVHVVGRQHAEPAVMVLGVVPAEEIAAV